jgi:hypothetical protein
MHVQHPKSKPELEQTHPSHAETRMADLVSQLTDEVSRAKMETFLHFAQDRSKIRVHVEPSRDHGLRFILSYPFAGD